MSIFNSTVSAFLEGHTVRWGLLVDFDFTNEPKYIWNGIGDVTIGGKTYNGLGQMGQIEDLEAAINGTAPEVTAVLSQVDADILRICRDEFDVEVKDRRMTVYFQAFRETADQPLDSPYAVYTGLMKSVEFTLGGVTERSIRLSIESLFTKRSRPPLGFYTSSDQLTRYPGDLGFEFTPNLSTKVVTWPDV